MTADEFFAFVEKTIRRRFDSGNCAEESSKLFFMLGTDSFAIVPCPSREFARSMIEASLPTCSAIGFVSEAWMAAATEDELKVRDPGTPVMSLPGSREVLMAIFYMQAMRPKFMSIPITRNADGSRVLGARESMQVADQLGGRLVEGLGNATHLS